MGTVGVLRAGSLIWFGNHVVTTWYEFHSPDQKYSLVARESTFLLLSDIRLYERTSPILVRELEADISTDDGFAAISNDAYKISWNEDLATLSVDMNQNGMWHTVKLNMAEHGKVLKEYNYYPNGKPAWLDRQDDANKNDESLPSSDNPESRDVQQGKADQKLIDGLGAVALTTGYPVDGNSEITYTAKGTPKLVLSSDLHSDVYILYDRDSSNGECALYVSYQLRNKGEENSDSQILEMYAYRYSNGRVRKSKLSYSKSSTYI